MWVCVCVCVCSVKGEAKRIWTLDPFKKIHRFLWFLTIPKKQKAKTKQRRKKKQEQQKKKVSEIIQFIQFSPSISIHIYTYIAHFTHSKLEADWDKIIHILHSFHFIHIYIHLAHFNHSILSFHFYPLYMYNIHRALISLIQFSPSIWSISITHFQNHSILSSISIHIYITHFKIIQFLSLKVSFHPYT